MLPYPLDHVGIAVEKIDVSLANYARDFGAQVTLREVLASQEVELAFLSLPNTKLELLAPLSDQSKLSHFLKKHGPGLHHLAFVVDNIEQELQRLKSLGHTLIDVKPRAGAAESKIAFLHPKSFGGVLYELVQLK